MYIKSILIITVVYVHSFQSFADDERRGGVKPTVDKVLELIGVGGGGGGGDYGNSKPAGSTTTGDNGRPGGQTTATVQQPAAGGGATPPAERPSYGGEEVSGCKVTLPARSSCCSCHVQDICGA